MAHNCLHLIAADSAPFVVLSKAGCFTANAFKDVLYKAVHDAHGKAGNTNIRMNLLRYFVNVDAVAFSSAATKSCGVGFLPFSLREMNINRASFNDKAAS